MHTRCVLLVLFAVLLFPWSCRAPERTPVAADILDPRGVPPQPGEDRWLFTRDLKTPMWTRHPWEHASPRLRHANLSGGVTLKAGFADPAGRLAHEGVNGLWLTVEFRGPGGSRNCGAPWPRACATAFAPTSSPSSRAPGRRTVPRPSGFPSWPAPWRARCPLRARSGRAPNWSRPPVCAGRSSHGTSR